MIIPKAELPVITAAITDLVNRFGHPDEIPLGEMEKLGVSRDSADLCMTLLTDELYPDNAAPAAAKWMRKIAEITK